MPDAKQRQILPGVPQTEYSQTSRRTYEKIRSLLRDRGEKAEVKRHLKGKEIPLKCLFIFSLIL